MQARRSGIYYALNPDTGAELWHTQVGPSIQWGSASDGTHIYVAIANPQASHRRKYRLPWPPSEKIWLTWVEDVSEERSTRVLARKKQSKGTGKELLVAGAATLTVRIDGSPQSVLFNGGHAVSEWIGMLERGWDDDIPKAVDVTSLVAFSAPPFPHKDWE